MAEKEDLLAWKQVFATCEDLVYPGIFTAAKVIIVQIEQREDVET